MPGLIETVHQVLDRRLVRQTDQPLALALSGGGDSVALALMAQAWADARGRRLLCLTVDHGLNPASPGWTETCRQLAAHLGADFQALTWTGTKPSQGLPAAARRARHVLLAEAARRAGASVILMGHTASDLTESAIMRQAGSSIPDVREWAPSPVWPEGRGVFLLRPMLSLTRSELRTWLGARVASWIEDPANEDPRFARSRARLGAASKARPAPTVPRDVPRALALGVSEDCGLTLPRRTLIEAEQPAALALVGMACVCVGGGDRLPHYERLQGLTAALYRDRAVSRTLAGAQVLADQDTIRWVRPAGEIRRSGTPDLHLAPGEVGIWDGRFEIRARTCAWVSALEGHRGDISKAMRAQLRSVPVPARSALPWVSGPPGSDAIPEVEITSLVLKRFQAAAGLITCEPSGLQDVVYALNDRISESEPQQICVSGPPNLGQIALG
ncbi:MAG: tRNA lysidine(34) synthetase TilS [Phenylobacterium zucineum]|nr:MAG: tRNA lysidine(34) synthetase TilS [Phenylobacterium zucineum]